MEAESNPYEFNLDEVNEPKNWMKSQDSAIYISWAAVIAYLNDNTNSLFSEFLECTEVNLQAMWLNIYCMYYDLRNRKSKQKKSSAELQRELFFFNRKYNEFKCKSDSNISQYVHDIRNELINTSGIDDEKQKYEEYLNFCIAETESTNIEKQKKFSVLTEILLFIIAFVQVAPMLYDFLIGNYNWSVWKPILVLFVIAAVCIIIIIRKE